VSQWKSSAAARPETQGGAVLMRGRRRRGFAGQGRAKIVNGLHEACWARIAAKESGLQGKMGRGKTVWGQNRESEILGC
jgi:hypothetical protein